MHLESIHIQKDFQHQLKEHNRIQREKIQRHLEIIHILKEIQHQLEDLTHMLKDLTQQHKERNLMQVELTHLLPQPQVMHGMLLQLNFRMELQEPIM